MRRRLLGHVSKVFTHSKSYKSNNEQARSNNKILIGQIIFAVPTLGLALFAYLSWDTQTSYYEKTTRPFVNAVIDSIPKTPNNLHNVYYKLKNYGSTPAQNVQCKIHILGHKNQEPELEFDPNDVNEIIFPNSEMQHVRHNIPIDPKSSPLYFHIMIYYEKIDGEKCHTEDVSFIREDGAVIHDRTYFD